MRPLSGLVLPFCAWVLWGWAPESPGDPKNLGTFTPIAGHDTLQKCTDAKGSMERLPGRGPKASTYTCLPDTVDPRKPR